MSQLHQRPDALFGVILDSSAATYSKASLNILSRLNQTGPEPCGEVTYGRRNVRDEHQAVGRVDYQFSSKQSIFARYMATNYKIGVPAQLNPGRSEERRVGKECRCRG